MKLAKTLQTELIQTKLKFGFASIINLYKICIY